MSYINETCVYASVCSNHAACLCYLWDKELEQDVYDSLKKEFDEENAKPKKETSSCSIWGEEYDQEVRNGLHLSFICDDDDEYTTNQDEEAEWQALKESVYYSDEDGWTI